MIRIAELPFREKPLLELLNLDGDRDEPAHDYAGYGWARAERLWLATHDSAEEVEDALVLALHTADDAEAIPDDIDLEFELPEAPSVGPAKVPRAVDFPPSVAVLASLFLELWLPKLPRDPSAIVLALCNPHGATLRWPAASPAPIRYASGDVYSWIDRETREVHLVGDRWHRLAA